jgi:hypothetical protein
MFADGERVLAEGKNGMWIEKENMVAWFLFLFSFISLSSGYSRIDHAVQCVL